MLKASCKDYNKPSHHNPPSLDFDTILLKYTGLKFMIQIGSSKFQLVPISPN